MKSGRITVFTKPWTGPLEGLAEKIAALGFDGVELAVRPGYQVTPDENVTAGLLDAVRTFKAHGLVIDSIASEVSERTIAACGDAGIDLIRTMAPIDMTQGYAASVDGYRRHYDSMLPLLDRHGVTLGVQNHYGYFIGSAAGLMQLVGHYAPKHVCAVLDMAHCGVAGEPTDMAVNIAKSHITRLVNFKSAFRKRQNGPEEEARFRVHWTTHQHGAYSWKDYVTALREMGYRGSFCLPAEYSDPSGKGQRMGDGILPLVREDLAHLRSLLEGAAG